MRHETPNAVASLLARYAPKKLGRLLDPATGTGVLVRPFLRGNPELMATCIDSDKDVTALVAMEFGSYPNVDVVVGDFLSWAEEQRDERFDCVVMNPPFAARKQNLVKIKVPSLDGRKEREASVSVEAAFVYSAIKLLRAGGRLLAILPASIVSADSGLWLRRVLIQSGAVRLVHELPARTFSGIEGKIFVFVYEHKVAQVGMALRNHRLRHPDELIISKKVIEETMRFDFGFQESMTWYRNLQSLSDLGWAKFGDLAECWRGEVNSPITESVVLHTTNFSSFRPTEDRAGNWQRPVLFGDLILKRVGRNSAESWLPYLRRKGARCSDCILIARPKPGVDPLSLLFALRVLLTSGKGAALIERGIGATYITMDALEGLWVPCSLGTIYLKSFDRFRFAARQRRWADMMAIEKSVRRYVERRLKSQ